MSRLINPNGAPANTPPDLREQLEAYRQSLCVKLSAVDKLLKRLESDKTLSDEFNIMAGIALETTRR